MQVKFVTGEPALLCGKTLVISDLHMGIEYAYRKSGINLPSQSEKLVERIEKLLNKTRAKSLIFLGDVKHKVPGTSWQEEKEIPGFLSHLLGRVKVEVTPGNHDGNLRNLLPRGVKLHPSSGFLFGDFYFSHGHTWPDPKFLKAKHLVIGHSQPMIEFRDKLGYRWLEPVWVRTNLLRKKVSKRYKGSRGSSENLPRIIIMPAFNEFAGGVALNRKINIERKREFISPILKFADMKKAEVLLLDGTFLGELGKI